MKDEIELSQEVPIEKTQISEFEFDRNNIDKTLKNHGDDRMDEDDSDDDDEGKQKEEKDGPIKIASGIYAFKFMITQTSWKNISKRKKNNLNEK